MTWASAVTATTGPRSTGTGGSRRGGGLARYQDVETDPAFRRQGLAGTLVWHAGRYGHEVLRAGTLVIVADPAEAAIRVYRACGFADRESQVSFERPPGE